MVVIIKKQQIVLLVYFLNNMKLYKLILIMIVIGVGAYFIGGKFNPDIRYQAGEKVIVDNLSQKVNELKGALVSDIQKCESAGYDESDGIITFDGNKNNKKIEIPSIGTYQFKKSTIIYYYDTLYQKDITGKEAVLIALDDEKAGQLASDVIFKTSNGLSNWYNCSKKINAQSRLDIINSLLK